MVSTAALMRLASEVQASGHYEPRAAYGHIPFPGHRTLATIDLIQKTAEARSRARLAKHYGYVGPL